MKEKGGMRDEGVKSGKGGGVRMDRKIEKGEKR
jgi:hypothetical protein